MALPPESELALNIQWIEDTADLMGMTIDEFMLFLRKVINE